MVVYSSMSKESTSKFLIVVPKYGLGHFCVSKCNFCLIYGQPLVESLAKIIANFSSNHMILGVIHVLGNNGVG